MSIDLSAALADVQGFRLLSEEIRRQLAAFASFRMVRAGETIFCQGEPSPYCFGVLSGEVVIQHVAKDRRFPPKILGFVGEGQLFGESSIFDGSPRQAMASANKDGKLIAIRGQELRHWIAQHPQVAQPLLLALLQSATNRLHQTSQELAVIHGIGRLLGSEKPFLEQLSAALDFLKGSLEGLDDLIFYQRSAYWEEFSPIMSLPVLQDVPAIPLSHEFVQAVSAAGNVQPFSPQHVRAALATLKLPWEDRAAMAILPLWDRDQSQDPLQGLLLFASQNRPHAFAPDKHLLLMSMSYPLAEALSRYTRQADVDAQVRLQKSKKSFPL